jgi:membrane complex biogenesis BtpA family protein
MKTLDFKRRPLLIGVIHLPALPGAPNYRGSFDAILERATADAKAYEKGGADALVIENFGDAPFTSKSVAAETIAAMARAGAAVREVIKLPIGYNVLRNDARAALGLAAACDGSFIRVNIHSGAMITDQGLIEGQAYDTVRTRQQLCPDVQILTDVHVKHAVPFGDWTLEDAARDTWERGAVSALIVSGVGTGHPASVEDVQTVRQAVHDAPILIGSGFNRENASTLLPFINGAIVGSSLKRDGKLDNPVDPARVAALKKVMK